jgi:hypothetical protein
MLVLGGATMVVSTASMAVTRIVVDKRKVSAAFSIVLWTSVKCLCECLDMRRSSTCCLALFARDKKK